MCRFSGPTSVFSWLSLQYTPNTAKYAYCRQPGLPVFLNADCPQVFLFLSPLETWPKVLILCIQSDIKYQGLLFSHCQKPLNSVSIIDFAWVRNYNKLSLYVQSQVFYEMSPLNLDIKQTKPKFLFSTRTKSEFSQNSLCHQ